MFNHARLVPSVERAIDVGGAGHLKKKKKEKGKNIKFENAGGGEGEKKVDQPPKGYWEDVRRQLGNRPIPSDIDLTLVFAVSRSVQSVTLYFTVTTHTHVCTATLPMFLSIST